MIAWEASCAILILAALAVRFLFRKKLGATARYALWAIVLLRLLLPLSIGRARVSVPGALEKLNDQLEYSYLETPLSEDREFDSMEAYDAYVTEHRTVSISGQPNGELREVVISGDPDKPVKAVLPHVVQWTEVVRFVWIVGAAAAALWFGLVNLRFAREIPRGRARLDTDAALPVYTAPGVETPCLFGLLRPAVYLPPEVAADGALRRYAVAHELTHYRHADHIWAAARCLCVALHWWDPLVWIAAVCARRDAELACDASTLSRLGAAERRPYGEALIRMTIPDRAYLLRAATMMSGNDLKERIKMIAQNRKTVRLALIAAAVLLALAAVFVFAGNSGGSRLFDAAAPERSAMTLYRLDEDGGKIWNLYDAAQEKEILSRLKKIRPVPASYRIPDEITYPLYGLEIGTREGNTARFLWIAGYLFDWTGNVYEFKFPFESLLDYDWRYHGAFESVAGMPNGAMLDRTGAGWAAERLTPAREPEQAPPEGLSMTVTQITRQAVTVRIENRGSETWYYGDPYAFEVLLDGAWYQVPLRPTDRNYGFNDIAWMLEPGGSVQCVCSLEPYHTPLLPGVYRVVKSGLSARFELRADGTGTPGSTGAETPTEGWREAYLDFFSDTLLPMEADPRTDRKIFGTALIDFDFDGVPELVVWDYVASAAAHCTVWHRDGADVAQIPGWEFDTSIQTGRVSDRPAVRPAQTHGFWLAQDRDSGAYCWIVHSGNGQDEHGWGSYILLDGSGAVLTGYDVTGGIREAMDAAWQTFMDRYTLLDLDYSDFTLSIYEVTHIDETRFSALLDAWRPADTEQTPRYPSSFEQQRLDDPGRWQEQLRRWNDEVSMIGEEFVSQAGEAGDWWDVPVAFADRWCEKYLNAGADSPFAGAQCGTPELGTWLDCISLTGAPRRLAFSVALTLVPRDEAAFAAARMGWVQTVPGESGGPERLRIQTEAVLVSDDGVRWSVEALNSGGSGGWGYRTRDSVETQTEIAYALSGQDVYGVHLLRYLPNLRWAELSAAQFNTVSKRLRKAALKTPEVNGGENDQLYRDLYMLWGFKNADGAYAALFVDGPDSPLAIQQRADPETFAAALAEMDAQTRQTVQRALGLTE